MLTPRDNGNLRAQSHVKAGLRTVMDGPGHGSIEQ